MICSQAQRASCSPTSESRHNYQKCLGQMNFPSILFPVDFISRSICLPFALLCVVASKGSPQDEHEQLREKLAEVERLRNLARGKDGKNKR